MNKSKAWEIYKNKDRGELIKQLQAESKKFPWGEDVPDTRRLVTTKCIEGFERTLAEVEAGLLTALPGSRDELLLLINRSGIQSILADLREELQAM